MTTTKRYEGKQTSHTDALVSTAGVQNILPGMSAPQSSDGGAVLCAINNRGPEVGGLPVTHTKTLDKSLWALVSLMI